MPRYIINELMGEQRIFYLVLYIVILVGYTFAAASFSNWLLITGFTHRITISQRFNEFLHEKTINADYADIEQPLS